MKLVLFDIDGTLLGTDGAGRRAIHRALLDETGTAGPIEQYRFDGKTDPQIIGELLALAGHAGARDRACIDAVCRRYVEHLRAELDKPTQTTTLMPGTRELLGALESHEAAGRALVGLLTGNLAGGAAMKLRSAGLARRRFVVGAYGSDSPHRPELPAIAARRAAERTGQEIPGRDVVIIGDTPDDVACGEPIGARVVAVATGFSALPGLGAARRRRRARVRGPARHRRSTRRDSRVSRTHDELELKARVEDPAALERLLLRAGAEVAFRGAMVDRRFDRGGVLAQRDEVLRLRLYQPPAGPAAGVLSWKGPVSVRNE